MANFSKSDLAYQDYSWTTTEGDSKKVTGFPDNILLNRKEGYEVVHFIDRFIAAQTSWASESPSSKKSLGNKIEKLIHDKLPGEIRSHAKVHSWVIANW